jgi:hypothetical protein
LKAKDFGFVALTAMAKSLVTRQPIALNAVRSWLFLRNVSIEVAAKPREVRPCMAARIKKRHAMSFVRSVLLMRSAAKDGRIWILVRRASVPTAGRSLGTAIMDDRINDGAGL